MAATDPVASWWLKVERAHKHFADVKAIIRSTVPNERLSSVRVEKDYREDEWVYSLHLDIDLPTELALAIGDFLFNMASALDHITTANAGGVGGNHTNFPIFPVDIRHDGPYESKAHSRWHDRWEKTRNAVDPAVFAVIEEAQPFMYTVKGTAENMQHPLALLNNLHNADKHERLNVIAHGLSDLVAVIDGIVVNDVITPGTMIKDGAAFLTHPREVDVELTGTVVLAILGGLVVDHYVIPQALNHIDHWVPSLLRRIEAVMP